MYISGSVTKPSHYGCIQRFNVIVSLFQRQENERNADSATADVSLFQRQENERNADSATADVSLFQRQENERNADSATADVSLFQLHHFRSPFTGQQPPESSSSSSSGPAGTTVCVFTYVMCYHGSCVYVVHIPTELTEFNIITTS